MKRVLFLALVILVIATGCASAQYDGVVSGSPQDCQGEEVGTVGAPQVEYAPPLAPQMVRADERPPVVDNNTNINDNSYQPAGSNGQNGRDGRNGRNGRNGTTRTITRYVKDSSGYERTYKQIQKWNPASRSYVDARDAKTLDLAKAYTNGQVNGIRNLVTPTPPAKKGEAEKEKKPMHTDPYVPIYIIGIVMAGVVGIIAIIVMANKQVEMKKSEHDLKVAEIAEKVADQDMPDVEPGETCFYRTSTTRGGTISKTMKRTRPHGPVTMGNSITVPVAVTPIVFTLAQVQQMTATPQQVVLTQAGMAAAAADGAA